MFVGDAAHQVSPFGARGANSGVEDAENLAWKLVAVLRGDAGEALIESYELERMQAADENIGHSTRSTDFIAPRSPAERTLRNAVLSLAPHADFARRMVNSGRLSVASVYDTPLSTPDEESFGGSAQLGGPAVDAPMTAADNSDCHLVEKLSDGFELLYVANGTNVTAPAGIKLTVIGRDLIDTRGDFAARFDAQPGLRLSAAAGPAYLCALAHAERGEDRRRARPRAAQTEASRRHAHRRQHFGARVDAMLANLGADLTMLVQFRVTLTFRGAGARECDAGGELRFEELPVTDLVGARQDACRSLRTPRRSPG